MSVTPDQANEARAALSAALLERGVHATEEALYWLLGIGLGESGFGTGPDWTVPNALNPPGSPTGEPPGPSYNWGAVQAVQGQKAILHYDHDKDGNRVVYRFARYDSPKDGAAQFLKVLVRGSAIPSILAGQGTARDLAAAMKANGYYTGTPEQGDEQGRIAAYASMIASGAGTMRKLLLGVSPGAVISPTSPVTTFQVGAGAGVLALVSAALGAAAWYVSRH